MNQVATKENTKEQESSSSSETKRLKVYSPNVDVWEKEEALIFHVEMPGVEQKDVEVTVEKDQLTIEGKFSQAFQPTGDLRLQEFQEGSYFRKFTLGKPVRVEEAKATMKDGVLELVLPKLETKKTKVEIQVS